MVGVHPNCGRAVPSFYCTISRSALVLLYYQLPFISLPLLSCVVQVYAENEFGTVENFCPEIDRKDSI